MEPALFGLASHYLSYTVTNIIDIAKSKAGIQRKRDNALPCPISVGAPAPLPERLVESEVSYWHKMDTTFNACVRHQSDKPVATDSQPGQAQFDYVKVPC
jgi:hypothetical protein